ncbi:DUF6318 family protein [Sinomonas notoginsengisoli]|uniref:DUF6318 family protein n=1 Tax=Sinomonas notoginsengisoli TaxID=1457311 RepID=UPI001F27906A|nr:DUF6318 family protein [Sinomonas notoginsengisoli]
MAIRRRTLRSALPVLALACVLGLSACGGGAGADAGGSPAAAPETAASTPSVDTRPTPASSTGPARNIPKPELPAAAKENTEAGFAAFTQYWFDTVTYALETGDTGPLKAVSKPDCKICNGFADEAQQSNARGNWTIPTTWKVNSFHSDLKLDPLGQAVGYYLIGESSSADFHADGSLATARPSKSNDTPRAMYAVFQQGSWVAAQAGNA